jgi:hypothetical protein
LQKGNLSQLSTNSKEDVSFLSANSKRIALSCLPTKKADFSLSCPPTKKGDFSLLSPAAKRDFFQLSTNSKTELFHAVQQEKR